MKEFICKKCKKEFKLLSDLVEHVYYLHVKNEKEYKNFNEFLKEEKIRKNKLIKEVIKKIIKNEFNLEYELLNRKERFKYSSLICSNGYSISVNKEHKDKLKKIISNSGFGTIVFKNKMKEKYGEENISKLSDFREKAKNTTIERYGTNNMFGEVAKRNNVKTINDIPGMKKRMCKSRLITIQKKYGNNIVNAGQSEEVKKKIAITNKEKYGVECFFMSDEFFIITQNKGTTVFKRKKHKLKNGKIINYQSKPELEFIKYCEYNNIEIENGPTIKYFFKDRNRNYYIDFKIKENDNWRLIEIKGKHKWFLDDLRGEKSIYQKIIAAKLYSEKNNLLPYRMIFPEQITINEIKLGKSMNDVFIDWAVLHI